jgi:hypothetical protein
VATVSNRLFGHFNVPRSLQQNPGAFVPSLSSCQPIRVLYSVWQINMRLQTCLYLSWFLSSTNRTIEIAILAFLSHRDVHGNVVRIGLWLVNPMLNMLFLAMPATSAMFSLSVIEMRLHSCLDSQRRALPSTDNLLKYCRTGAE